MSLKAQPSRLHCTLSPLPFVSGSFLSTFECVASSTKPTNATVLPSPSFVPSPSEIMLESLARLGGGSPFGMLGSLLLASFRSPNVLSVTEVILFTGAQKLFFIAFCLSLAALLWQPLLRQRKSICCGLLVSGLSCSGRGLPHFMNFVFFADATAGRSRTASVHATPISVCRFI